MATSQGGQRWGWTNASNTLNAYSNPWENLGYWQGIYGNATIRFVGVALEYWAVNDAGGLNQPLFADQLVLNGVTYISLIPIPPLQMIGQCIAMTHRTLEHQHLTLLMQYPSGNLIQVTKSAATPAIANGVVYEGSNNGYLYALNATIRSALIWQYNSGSQIESSAAVANGVVYVGILWDGHQRLCGCLECNHWLANLALCNQQRH